MPHLSRRARDDGDPGIAARVFSATARLGVSVVMFSQASSEQNIALVIPDGDRARTVSALEQEFRWERLTGAIDSGIRRAPIAVVAAVGEGMRGTPGIAAKVFAAVARAKVNVEAIAQGSSECNISFAVDGKDRDKAVRALHRVVAHLDARRRRPSWRRPAGFASPAPPRALSGRNGAVAFRATLFTL